MADTRTSANITFHHAYEKTTPKLTQKLKPYDYNLYGCNYQPIQAKGIVSLPIELGNSNDVATNDIEFLVVGYWLPYNAILGWLTESAFRMITLLPHLKAKLWNPIGFGICWGSR